MKRPVSNPQCRIAPCRAGRRRSMPAALSLIAGLWLAAGTAGGDTSESDGQLALFSSDATLEITLHAPWRRLVRERGEPVAHHATLELAGEDRRRIGLTVERRGKSRLEVCSFPPIRLRFPDPDAAAGTPFDGARSLKMVTHCNLGSRWEQYYVREMLAFRFYNLITERSFRVRPLSVVYSDSERDDAEGPRFAFVIENDDTVAERNGLEEIKLARIAPSRLEPLESSRFALFQYMIGNADWSSLSGPTPDECCHNTKLIGAGPDGPIYALPYDFDSTGFVDAHYAVPQEVLPITRVTQRLFRGFCVHNETLESARREFLDRKRDFFGVLDNEPRLNGRSRRKAERYLDDFFDVLADSQKFERRIIRTCRK
ncbi:MAG: hypothetical protein RQ847_01515 [Wenzhouxiangellaceae bacterium]|nr:hypothetical protein [Wenzhouxiangellaceae bacterium]